MSKNTHDFWSTAWGFEFFHVPEGWVFLGALFWDVGCSLVNEVYPYNHWVRLRQLLVKVCPYWCQHMLLEHGGLPLAKKSPRSRPFVTHSSSSFSSRLSSWVKTTVLWLAGTSNMNADMYSPNWEWGGFSNVMLVFRGAIIMPPVMFLFCCLRIFANFDGTSADIGPDFNSGWVIYDNQKSAEYCG